MRNSARIGGSMGTGKARAFQRNFSWSGSEGSESRTRGTKFYRDDATKRQTTRSAIPVRFRIGPCVSGGHLRFPAPDWSSMSPSPETRPSLLVRLADRGDQAAWTEFAQIYT